MKCEVKRCRLEADNLWGAQGYYVDPIELCDRHFVEILETPNDKKLAKILGWLKRPHQRSMKPFGS